ncbi:MAG: AAA family ATPase [archaeon]|nr:AAA family ATPase [archaeon]
MLIKKIQLKNIRSYKDEEIIFPKGSSLLSGDIGSGKTSVLLGIEFALFGLQPGQRGSSLLRNDSKEGGVKIEFEVDGKNIIIERMMKRGKSISQEYCAITIDNEKKEISVSELKNIVLELLNYPKEFAKKQNMLYRFTVYTPQEEMKQIILEDPQTRIDTLRHVFGIDKYKQILENTSIVLSKIREERRRREGMVEFLEQDKLGIIEKETDLETKYYNLSSVEKELFLKTEKRKSIEEESEEINKKIEEKIRFEQEIEKTKIMLMNKKEAIFNNQRSIPEIKKQIEELAKIQFDESKIKHILEEIILDKKEKEKLNEENLRISSQLSSINMKTEENKLTINKISKLEICPTCLQNVDAVYKSNVLNKAESELAENKRKIESLTAEKSEIQEKIKSINSDISFKENQVNELRILKIRLEGINEKQKRLEDLEKTDLFLEKDMELLNKHVDILKESVFELKKFESIFELKERELSSALKEERFAEIKVAELKKEIDLFSRQIEEMKLKIKRTEGIKKQLDYLIELENWLSKKFTNLISVIEKNVMAKLKSEFSKLFSNWFSMLVSEDFNARLDEDFTPIIGQHDYEIDYAYLSGGERTAVALAYRLALNQVINSFLSKIKTKDLVILDEPTDGFSEQQLDKMRDILLQLNVAQLILVSHEQKIESFVENVLKFKKENGITRVEK